MKCECTCLADTLRSQCIIIKSTWVSLSLVQWPATSSWSRFIRVLKRAHWRVEPSDYPQWAFIANKPYSFKLLRFGVIWQLLQCNQVYPEKTGTKKYVQSICSHMKFKNRQNCFLLCKNLSLMYFLNNCIIHSTWSILIKIKRMTNGTLVACYCTQKKSRFLSRLYIIGCPGHSPQLLPLYTAFTLL